MNAGQVIQNYIKFRDSLGYKNSSSRSSACHILIKFSEFLGDSIEFEHITEEDCASFLNRSNTEVTSYWKIKHTVLKKLFEWATIRGYAKNIVIPKYIPKLPDSHPAYIYSHEELNALFSASLNYMKGDSITDPQSIQFILKITYALGLRISETLNLRFKHIDDNKHVVLIEESKFFKSRYVTYNDQVSNLIHKIFEWRKLGGFAMAPDDYIFISKVGKPVNLITLHGIFAKIRKKANLHFPELKNHQPRIHDLRHTFAVHVLTTWYKEGKDVQSLLPKLSTYLGHKNISHTSIYLTKTFKILEEANKLFYKYKNQ